PSLFRVFVGKRLRATGPERARFDGRRSLREPEFGPRMGETGFCVMQPSEALSASAQVAVTLAGFAGVVVAFRSGSVHEWSNVDKFRLRILLINSAIPFVLSMVAMLLSSTALDQNRLWQVCSILGFVLVVIIGFGACRGRISERAGSVAWFFIAAASSELRSHCC